MKCDRKEVCQNVKEIEKTTIFFSKKKHECRKEQMFSQFSVIVTLPCSAELSCFAPLLFQRK